MTKILTDVLLKVVVKTAYNISSEIIEINELSHLIDVPIDQRTLVIDAFISKRLMPCQRVRFLNIPPLYLPKPQ